MKPVLEFGFMSWCQPILPQFNVTVLLSFQTRTTNSSFTEMPMDRKQHVKRAFAVAVGIIAALAFAHDSLAAERVRVRGTVESLDGETLKLKTRDDKRVTVVLKTDWSVRGRFKVSAADIKPGDFVGIASEPTSSGVNGALEVVIFPVAMKGTGEGDRPWSGKPNSSMTNATVANAVKSVDGPTLTLTYRGGEKKISIPQGTPVVTLGPATKDDIKTGASVLISGENDGDGAISSKLVEVDKGGIAPPM